MVMWGIMRSYVLKTNGRRAAAERGPATRPVSKRRRSIIMGYPRRDPLAGCYEQLHTTGMLESTSAELEDGPGQGEWSAWLARASATNLLSSGPHQEGFCGPLLR